MKDWKNTLYDLPAHLLSWIWAALLILEMVLAFFVLGQRGIPALRVVGWVLWAVGIVFAFVPIFTLRAKGGVLQGQSYMKTTVLVDTGIYAIVRHPQGGTAGILFFLALLLIGQHWVLVSLSAVGIGLLYVDALKADQRCIEKFGHEYLRYMQRVPAVNFIAGIIRLLRGEGSDDTGP